MFAIIFHNHDFWKFEVAGPNLTVKPAGDFIIFKRSGTTLLKFHTALVNAALFFFSHRQG
jgi:hypothetical protein